MGKKRTGLILFSIGASGYGILEILWRGFTHWSMLCAGGICFVFFAKIETKFKHLSLIFKAILGSFVVTAVEFVFGVIFNIILKKNVWDYSKMPLNLFGQICLVYSFFWSLLGIIFIPLAGFIKNKILKA